MRVLSLILFVSIYIQPGYAFNLDDSSDIKSKIEYEKLYHDYQLTDNPDSTIFYASLLLELYQEEENISKVSEIYYETAEYLINTKQYKLTSKFLESYVEFAEKTGDEKQIAKSYFLTGAFFNLANINKDIALEYYNKSLTIFKKLEDDYFIAVLYRQLGSFYEQALEDYEKTLEYYYLGIEICKENNFYNLLYRFYRQLAETFRHRLNDYSASVKYYKTCLQLAEEKKDTSKIIDALVEHGCVAVQYNKPDSVIQLYYRALGLAEKINSRSLTGFCYSHLSAYYEKNGNYEKALYYLYKDSSNLNLYMEGNWLPQPLLKMAEFERKLGNHKRANEHYKKYILLKDSLDRITKAETTSRLELKFALENIEKENLLKEEKSKATLQRQKTIRNFLVLLTSLLILLAFLIYRYYINQQKNNKKLNEANKKLHEADKMKLRFFTNISHEIRTPLTLLISPLERLKARYPALINDSLISTMINNGKSLKNIINQLLDVSKMDSEKLTLLHGQYNFNDVFSATTSLYLSTADEKKINYQVRPLQSKLIFSFDKERIEQVINNLLSNAFKYTPEGGEVIASVSKFNGELLLSVKDTGIGIPEASINNVFDRFYQSGTGRSEVYGGTGIGLNIVKEYVELHNGTVAVVSEPGKGSEFLVKLPLTDYKNGISENKKDFTVNNTEILSGSGTKLKKKPEIKTDATLLIVEDNKDLVNYLNSIFEEYYTILNASNGKEAMEVTLKNMPDIIISDVMMPECDGFEFTGLIKSNIETSHIPVILLTAKIGNEDKIDGYKHGADDYIAKPFDEKELILKVQNLCITLKRIREKYIRNFITTPTPEITLSLDEQFLSKVMEIVESNISRIDFSVEQLCKEIAMSRRSVFGKIKALTNMTPSEFIRVIRLKHAAQLLKQKAGSISDIAYKTGFESPSYFAKCFKEVFGKSPSEFI